MKNNKYFLLLGLLIIISGCSFKKTNNNDNENTIKKEIKEEKKDKKKIDYKIKINEKTKKINDKVKATYTSVIVSDSKKEKESDKINDYLAEKINIVLNEFEENIKEEYLKDSSYVFDYKYSLVKQNSNYLIFKLTYYHQMGGPYTINGTEYYIFDKYSGDIVKFDDLFTSDIEDKVYNYVVDYLKKIYKESEIEYNPDDYDLKESMFKEGYYLLVDNKLSFHFPRSLFTAAAFGSIDIDIDETIYSNYIIDVN